MTNPVEQRERISAPTGFAGLHARLLLTGDALNPGKTDLPAVTREALAVFEQRDYGPYEQPSLRERMNYWQGKEDDIFDRQKQTWITNTSSLFTNSKAFFTESGKGRQWSAVFTRLGIDATNFDQTAAQALYNKYFAGEAAGNPVKAFVSNALNGYQATDLPAIEWLANIFGQNSSEVVHHLVEAEAQLLSQPDAIVSQANENSRLNNLNDDEKRILTFLWPNGQPQATTETATAPTPVQSPTVETPPQAPPEQIVPNVNLGENIRAVDQYIRTLRDPARYRENTDGDARYLLHEFGFTLAKPVENAWFPASLVDIFESRYKLPLALYIAGNHANLVLTPPYEDTDGQWKIKVYDPMNPGEHERILPNYGRERVNYSALPEPYRTRRRLQDNNIHANQLASAAITQNQYDISLSRNPQIQPHIDAFMRGKLAALQQDAKNCIPYCHFVGALLNALKSGETDFKKEGIPQFAQDFGIKIKTLEEILGENS